MSIQSQIDRIKGNVASAYSAVSDKGGTIPQTANSENLSEAINSIPTNGGEIYSTEETKIGTWIDGNPLYRLVITSTVPKNNSGWVFVTQSPILDMKTCVILSGVMVTNPTTAVSKFVSCPNQHVVIGINSDNCVGATNNQSVYNNNEIIYIITYTKTTDAATAATQTPVFAQPAQSVQIDTLGMALTPAAASAATEIFKEKS